MRYSIIPIRERRVGNMRALVGALAVLGRRFNSSSGLVVHVLFNFDEAAWTTNNRTHMNVRWVDASVLRYDLSVSLASSSYSGQEESRLGVIFTPTERGCAFPRDAPYRMSAPPCKLGAEAYSALRPALSPVDATCAEVR